MSLVTIYWPSSVTHADMAKIRKRFGITAGVTINGETPADISEEDMPVLQETARRGYIQIRKYKPCLQGLFKNDNYVQNHKDIPDR